MTMTDIPSSRRPARVVASPALPIVRRWLKSGALDMRDNLMISMAYGLALAAAGWAGVALLVWLNLGWMLLPALAGLVLLGPLATVGLYHVARARTARPEFANGAQMAMAGAVMMVLVLAWIRAAVLLFAVFYGLHPFAGPLETLTTLFATGRGVLLVLSGSAVGGLFAALGFGISVFAFPMLVDRQVDCFSAMGLSLSATLQNFRLLVLWAVIVSGLVLFGVVTGLLGLIPVFPLLGYATWHAYADLFEVC